MPTLFLTASSAVTSADWKPIMDAVTAQISVSNVATVLGTIAGAGVGFAFFWWGGRKALRALMAAFKKGKISI